MNECIKLAYLCTSAFCCSVGVRTSRKMMRAPALPSAMRVKRYVVQDSLNLELYLHLHHLVDADNDTRERVVDKRADAARDSETADRAGVSMEVHYRCVRVSEPGLSPPGDRTRDALFSHVHDPGVSAITVATYRISSAGFCMIRSMVAMERGRHARMSTCSMMAHTAH